MAEAWKDGGNGEIASRVVGTFESAYGSTGFKIIRGGTKYGHFTAVPKVE